jgi:hypothetical protein
MNTSIITKSPKAKFKILKDDLDSKVLEKGPLESMFPGSEFKILDFLIAFQEYDYSISDISKNSGVGFKTTLGIIRKLESQKIILKERNVGRAQMYKLNLESEQAKSISKLALDIATERAIKQN